MTGQIETQFRIFYFQEAQRLLSPVCVQVALLRAHWQFLCVIHAGQRIATRRISNVISHVDSLH